MALDFISCVKGFVAVVECKSFAEAARQLHISNSTLTKQVQRLEDQIRKKLFYRTTRRVELTEAGQTCLQHAYKILIEVQNTLQAVQSLEQQPHGRLIIGMPNGFVSPIFIKIFQKFLQKYPKVSLEVKDENSPINLLNGVVDLILSDVDICDKQLIKKHCFTFYRSIYASPNYIKKFGLPKTIKDLKNHNCLIHKQVSPNNEWKLGKNKKIYVTGNYTAISGINIFYAAMNGLGLMWSNDLLIQEEIKKRKLIEVKLDKPPAEIKIYLYYRPVGYDRNVKLMVDCFDSASKHVNV